MIAQQANLFAPPRIGARQMPDGSLLFRSSDELAEPAPNLPTLLRTGADTHPDRPLVAQRGPAGQWRTHSYREVRRQADAFGAALLARGLGPERPLVVLSGNSIEHLVVTMGALTAGIPVAPISAAYSLQVKDHARLAQIRDLVRPGAVFASDAAAFGTAMQVFDKPGMTFVSAGSNPSDRCEPFDELVATPAGDELSAAFATVSPDSLAKIFFTSGSTGSPKGVLNTHRMLCANQQMIRQVWPFLVEEPPILVDWLPWSHAFGGNHNLHLVLANAGTLYIDEGRPSPDLFRRSIANLRDVPPTIYFNVPAGYARLVPELERDRDFAERFFSRLRLLFNAGAALPAGLHARLSAIGESIAGRQVPVMAGWGATETAPAVTLAHYPFSDARCIGVPLPGCEVKLTPMDDRYEIRVRGPSVTPGYLNRPDLTATAFDEDGFYRAGDAVRLADQDDPNAGFVFCGRIAEDFKLSTGTFVHVAAVRAALLSAAPVLADAVIAGEDRDRVCALAWLDVVEACALLGEDATWSGDLVDDERLRAHLGEALARLNANAGSASRVDALLLMSEPADLDAGEITDKGYVNQRRVLLNRKELVDRLFAVPLASTVIMASGRQRS